MTTNHATEYAHAVAEEVRAVNALLDHVEDGYDHLDEDTFDSLLEQAGCERETVFDTFDGLVGDAWLDNLLEVTVYLSLRRRADDDPRWIVRILRAVGGPTCHIEAESDNTDTVEVRCWWGSDTATVSVFAPYLCKYIGNYVAARS